MQTQITTPAAPADWFVEITEDVMQPVGCYPLAEIVAEIVHEAQRDNDLVEETGAAIARLIKGEGPQAVGGGAAPLFFLTLTATPDPCYGLEVRQ